MGKGKRVSFCPSEEWEVFEYEVEEVGEEEKGVGPTAGCTDAELKRTADYTILSSAHGRARRYIREITKFDLQAAVKYGKKTPGYPCRVTGQRRWKYEYGNIVYITDHSSKKEITSYKLPVNINPAPIDAEMHQRHSADCKALNADYHLCTSHSVIIIDQSGSMREADVPGFRNRSQAAYGVLALDYIAEQLENRDRNQATLDVVTIIAMRTSAEVLVNRQPLDWILFNRLLWFQQSSSPSYHGHYRNAIGKVSQIIEEDLALMEGIPSDEWPSFTLILLSDGRPSDKEVFDKESREAAIYQLAAKLQSKLSFLAMGVGPRDAEFSELKVLTQIACDAGASGEFCHVGLSAGMLSETFSSISSALTTTRTALLTVGASDYSRGTLKEFTLRKKTLPTSQRKYKRYLNEVGRWRYAHELFRAKQEPWINLRFRNPRTNGFEMETNPFGRGAERLAYMFYEIDQYGSRGGMPMVAKQSIYTRERFRDFDFHEIFCRVQRKAHQFAEKFNELVAKTPVLKPVKDGTPVPKIYFLKCSVYSFFETNGEFNAVLVEDYLKGKWTKFNSNNQHIYRNRPEDPTVDLIDGATVYMTDFLQAFSHWVYFTTNQKLLLCDLQGVLDMEGRYPNFKLSDPCICSKHDRGQYGKTDIGLKGMRNFKQVHRCNKVCSGLGLPSF